MRCDDDPTSANARANTHFTTHIERAPGLKRSPQFTAAVFLSAQSGTVERKEKTKIEIKGGKDVTVTGCLARSSGSTDYVLTNDIGSIKYAVVTDDDLSKYVDRRVEMKGKAADQGDGKIQVERKVEGTTGDKADVKVERDGDSTALPFLGMKSIKAVSSSCKF